MANHPLCALVPCPPAASLNSGKRMCPTDMLVAKFGPPRQKLTDECQQVTSLFWRQRMVTRSVGPFRVTGHHLAVRQLELALADLAKSNPKLYKVLGTAGGLCCRRVRGSENRLSNHGLGLAFDFMVAGVLDVRGDGKVQKGLLQLYQVLKQHGFYWLAECSTEDAMHFEICAALVQEWIDTGIF